MTLEQRDHEIIKTTQELGKIRELIKMYTQRYNEIQYSYGKEYIDTRLNIKEYLASKSETMQLLTLKLTVLLDPGIDLINIEVGELETITTLHRFQMSGSN